MIELREGGYSLHFLIQVDVLAHKIPIFIERAARAGCRYVFVGLESSRRRAQARASRFAALASSASLEGQGGRPRDALAALSAAFRSAVRG